MEREYPNVTWNGHTVRVNLNPGVAIILTQESARRLMKSLSVQLRTKEIGETERRSRIARRAEAK
jgi:hypothetical protein